MASNFSVTTEGLIKSRIPPTRIEVVANQDISSSNSCIAEIAIFSQFQVCLSIIQTKRIIYHLSIISLQRCVQTERRRIIAHGFGHSLRSAIGCNWSTLFLSLRCCYLSIDGRVSARANHPPAKEERRA